MLMKILNIKERPDLKFKHDFTEAVFIELDKSIYNRDKNIIVGCVYRAPNTDIETFNRDLESILSRLHKEGKLIYLMGTQTLIF